ncbi:Uncharacterised protein [Bordetella pertussis]|nr:Uncharacterised protein [Bordetella pertussis]
MPLAYSAMARAESSLPGMTWFEALGADEQDVAATGDQLLDELRGFLVLGDRLLEVDDVNLVTVTEDVRGHLGVPVTGLVAEVDASFQHFTHEGHNYLRGLSLALHPHRIKPTPWVA